jgi:parallel beta-helix repeat protein
MAHYTDWPEYPTDLLDVVDYPTQADDVDDVEAWGINSLVHEMIAVQKELGTIPKGSFADVKTRLDAPKIEVCNVFTSAGINACIDALGATGGIVFLPKGTYTINSTITIDYNNTILMGSGWGTKLDASAWSTGHVIDLNGCDYCQIRDLQIEGNDGGGNSKSLIYSSYSDYTLISNCYLHHSDDDAISLINDSDFCKIINNHFTTNDSNAIYLDDSYDCIVKNNVIANDNRGIKVNGGTRCLIEGNVIRSSYYEAIKMQGTHSYGNIVGNILRETAGGDNEIYLDTCTYINISGNVFKSITTKSERAIYLENSDYCNIIGNLSSLHDTCGIELDATSNNNHVAWNQLEGEAVAKIVDSGSNNTVVNAVAGITTFPKLTVSTNLVIPSGTTPTPATEGALFLDTDAGANGTLVMYSNGTWRTIQAF